MNDRNYVCVTLNDFQWARANYRASQMPIYRLSGHGYEANIIGSVGEVTFEDYLRKYGIKFRRINETWADYIINDRVSVELKTKYRNTQPRADYEVLTSPYNFDHQNADMLVFVSLRGIRGCRGEVTCVTHANLVGGTTFDEFKDGCRLIPKGSQVYRAGMIAKADRLALPISSLTSMRSLVQSWRV